MSGNNKRILEHLDDKDFEKLIESCSCGGSSSEGLDVLKQNLAKIHEYSGFLLGLAEELSEVEDWVEDKVSKMSQSISDVKHYVDYKMSAYGVQQNGTMPHQPDSGERLPGLSVPQAKMPGDKLDVMAQRPSMTPPAKDSSGCGDMVVTTIPSHEEPVQPTASLLSVFGDEAAEPADDWEMPQEEAEF